MLYKILYLNTYLKSSVLAKLKYVNNILENNTVWTGLAMSYTSNSLIILPALFDFVLLNSFILYFCNSFIWAVT